MRAPEPAAWPSAPPTTVRSACAGRRAGNLTRGSLCVAQPTLPPQRRSSTGPPTTPRSSATWPSRSSTTTTRTPPRSSTPPVVPPASRTPGSCASSTSGTAGGVSWIIEEALASAAVPRHAAQQGPLPAEEARRIAGEAASALEKARQRGLHHLRLTPHAVLRTQDGTVKVTGIAIAAGIDGYEEPDDVAATRADTVGAWSPSPTPRSPAGGRCPRSSTASSRPPGSSAGWPHPPRSPRACPATSTPSAGSP